MQSLAQGGPLCPYQVCHSVTYLPHLFLYVAIAGLLHRSHQAFLLGTAVLFLPDTSVVSVSSFQRPGRAVRAKRRQAEEVLQSIVCWRHAKAGRGEASASGSVRC